MTHYPAAWALRGACNSLVTATTDPWLVDDELPESEQSRLERFARSVCNQQCPVKAECLDEALARREPNGIRAGLDPDERKALAKRPAHIRPSVYGTAAHGTNARYQSCKDGPDGKACAKCRRGRADYVAAYRLRRSWTTDLRSATDQAVVNEAAAGIRSAGDDHERVLELSRSA